MDSARETGFGAVPATGTAGMDRRWLAVGRSAEQDPKRAGAAAAAAALRGDDARLLTVFCSAHYDPAAVLDGINETTGGVPLVGCSSSAEIGSGGPGQGTVLVTAFGGPGFSVSTAAATGAASRPRWAGAQAAKCATQQDDGQDERDRPHRILVLFPDGLVPDQEEILCGAYQVVGASLPMVGGAASPDPAVRETFQLHNDEVLTDAVVGVEISSEAPFGIGVRHGWRKVGEPMIVTRSTKGRVYTLDDRPALGVYLQKLGAPAEAYTDPVVFDQFSDTRPIGVRRRSGEEVRNVSSTEYFSEGWLACAGEIPEGGLVWVMEGDEDTVLQASEDACRDAIESLGEHPPLGVLAFDCAARGAVLGLAGRSREWTRMTTQTKEAPVAGFYTWGEIARTRGVNGFHHQTLVVLAVG